MKNQKNKFIYGGAPASLARNSAAVEKRGGAKIPSPPQPPSFLPARAFGFQNSTSGFSSKKVRILTKRHRLRFA
ncbi:MAG: hypothetical protein A3H02_00180 [Candidatus Niyogibacteria bacterium RIFCSPLOWO2_12_FULL_41_13]|uniref:Uncharacterized protein n=1 Tax=Candidatus Niyogibacteria bacterium RIFCSPLOWO2_12_FULL_41_13 TaxID=1801726 RepID=A0A1G2F382_9BACT|nr:MAG: hypothetical protein A3H02_00180 [Candidatus Niyogibacteria bacterium RIFCSPLOWO2_12_FULL_41_13]